MSFEAKRCGVQFSPPALVLIYEHKETKHVRKRIIPVRNFSKYSGKARLFTCFAAIVFVCIHYCYCSLSLNFISHELDFK